ncbi:MAG: GyrI-like domain-containing protein [Firmicutes bacterium]|nr:GyrI-like domain-containing protein [Bacillota bacterium]
MKYELKHMDSFSAVCYKFAAPENGFWFGDSCAYWYGKDFSAVSKEDYQSLAAHGDAEIGVWLDADADTEKFSYYFGPVVMEGVNQIPAGMEKISIPEADYAVFTVPAAKDPAGLHENMQKAWKDILQWIHETNELKATAEKCMFEYYQGDVAAIYVPVIKA